MEPYSRYLEDEFFIDWVSRPTQLSDTYWESYIKENPSEKEIIYTLKEFLLSFRTKDFSLSQEEKEEILVNLLNNTSKTIKPKVFNLRKKHYKYAAIIVVAITVSVYLKFNKAEKLPFSNVNIAALDSITNTQLTFSTGEQHLIKEEKSIIEYNDLGSIIVNQKDTLNNNVIYKKEAVELLNTLITPYGKRSRITLSDGTIVHLNAGTEFVFPEKFLGNKRIVFLSGEAFFEVTSNKEKPFIVKTREEKLSIEVVGTKFNVSAYPSDLDVLTVLTEGKVNVVENNMLKNKKTSLIPGQLAIWNKDDENIKVKEVNTDNYTLWTQGLLYFESDSMINVIKKIERFYNIEITFDKSATRLANTSISGKLDLKDDIKKTLENLMITAKFNFEIIDNRTYIIK